MKEERFVAKGTGDYTYSFKLALPKLQSFFYVVDNH
jgi:hypothetical protein